MHGDIDAKRVDDGTAALVAWVRDSTLIVANAGDSRAVLGRGSGRALAMSEDHKPENPAESQSIRDKGGFVTENSRVCGILALSRALGDCELQECITWMPEVRYTHTSHITRNGGPFVALTQQQ